MYRGLCGLYTEIIGGNVDTLACRFVSFEVLLPVSYWKWTRWKYVPGIHFPLDTGIKNILKRQRVIRCTINKYTHSMPGRQMPTIVAINNKQAI